MAKLLTFSAKCSDMFSAKLQDGDKQLKYNGYVPRFLGGGDYVELTIDVETGQIQNWQPLTDERIANIFGGDDHE